MVDRLFRTRWSSSRTRIALAAASSLAWAYRRAFSMAMAAWSANDARYASSSWPYSRGL
jgi:hypothetical protein